MPGGSGMPAVSLPIFSWLTLFGAAHGVVEGRGHQVLEHVLVVGQQARVDGDALDVVLAGHGHLHQAGAGLAFDLDASPARPAPASCCPASPAPASSGRPAGSSSWWGSSRVQSGLIEPGTMRAVLNCDIRSSTSGSLRIAVSAWRWRRSRSAASRRAGESSRRRAVSSSCNGSPELGRQRPGRACRAARRCAAIRARRAGARSAVAWPRRCDPVRPASASSRTSAVIAPRCTRRADQRGPALAQRRGHEAIGHDGARRRHRHGRRRRGTQRRAAGCGPASLFERRQVDPGRRLRRLRRRLAATHSGADTPQAPQPQRRWRRGCAATAPVLPHAAAARAALRGPAGAGAKASKRSSTIVSARTRRTSDCSSPRPCSTML